MASCTKCGRATTGSSMCPMCSAGAPQSYAPKPGIPTPTSAYTGGTSAPAPSTPTPSVTHTQSQPTQPAHIQYPEKEKKVKPPKPPRPEGSSSDEVNMFALLGISHAFFAPFLGLVLSIIGFLKSDHYGGRTMSIVGIVVGAILSILLIVVIILMLVSDTFVIQINFL